MMWVRAAAGKERWDVCVLKSHFKSVRVFCLLCEDALVRASLGVCLRVCDCVIGSQLDQIQRQTV